MDKGERSRIPFYYHPDFSGYDFGATHPFRGSRFDRFMRELVERFPAVNERLEMRVPQKASDDLLMAVHSKSYLERVNSLETRRGFLSPDTQLLPGSTDAARLIVGASVAATRASVECGTAIGFGGLHHAGPNYGEGFCIFNDVAVSVAAVLQEGLDRVLVLDTDAHQGNGTMDIFYEDPRVLFISLHQDPRTLYPGRGFIHEMGKGDGEGYTVNIPMPVLADWSMYEMAMAEIVIPLLDAFQPELLIRNGGSDPLFTDTLTNLGLDLDALTGLIGMISRETRKRNIPLVDLFLSGYGPYVTEGWLAIIRGILDEEMELVIPEEKDILPPFQEEQIEREMRNTLDKLKMILHPFWNVFF